MATPTCEPLSSDCPIQGLCGDSGARPGPQGQVTTLPPDRHCGGQIRVQTRPLDLTYLSSNWEQPVLFPGMLGGLAVAAAICQTAVSPSQASVETLSKSTAGQPDLASEHGQDCLPACSLPARPEVGLTTGFHSGAWGSQEWGAGQTPGPDQGPAKKGGRGGSDQKASTCDARDTVGPSAPARGSNKDSVTSAQ